MSLILITALSCRYLLAEIASGQSLLFFTSSLSLCVLLPSRSGQKIPFPCCCEQYRRDPLKNKLHEGLPLPFQWQRNIFKTIKHRIMFGPGSKQVAPLLCQIFLIQKGIFWVHNFIECEIAVQCALSYPNTETRTRQKSRFQTGWSSSGCKRLTMPLLCMWVSIHSLKKGFKAKLHAQFPEGIFFAFLQGCKGLLKALSICKCYKCIGQESLTLKLKANFILQSLGYVSRTTIGASDLKHLMLLISKKHDLSKRLS